MLKKLYKHEFYSLFRSLLPIYAALFGFSVLSRLVYLVKTENNIINIFKTFAVIGYVLTIIAVFIVGIVIVVTRFYGNLLSNEGYLTFSLPFTATQHIVCKLICGAVTVAVDFVLVFLSLAVLGIGTKAENDFKVTPEELKEAVSERTKLLVLPYPCNPTGAIMERENLEKIAEILKDTNILVLSDEIYSELTFGGEKHVAPAAIDGMWERTVTVNGFSKAFSMTGWRLGYACGPAEIMKQITKIHQFAIMCAPTTSQYAAIEALKNCDEDVERMVKEYDMRRRLIVSGFNKLGLTCREPKGAFYAFPSIKSTGMSSEEFCEKLLYSKRVAVVPGTAFGNSGEGFVRASYCYSTEHIKEALERTSEFLKEIK